MWLIFQFQVGALFRKGERVGEEDENGDHVALRGHFPKLFGCAMDLLCFSFSIVLPFITYKVSEMERSWSR